MAGAGVDQAERPRRSASWALAARLARREVRRRKGRTALVMALVAIPVIAMTIASVAYRTNRDTHSDRFRRENGAADMVVWQSRAADQAAPIAFDPRSLPAGSRAVTVHEVYGRVRGVGGRDASVRFTDVPLADPLTDGMVRPTEGRVPAAADEALVSPEVARDLGVRVGDALRLEVPPATYRVVGLGRSATSLDSALMVVGAFDFAVLDGDYVSETLLVDLPPGVTAEQVGGADGRVGSPLPSPLWSERPSAAGPIWGWVAGALAFTVTGIVIAAAFATSARRQLVTLGQLASNGADRRLLRRTLALQGAWSGMLGALAGIGIGLAFALPQHGLFENIANHTLPGVRFAALDLAVIAASGLVAAAIAAFVPSRTITRVPVLSALGGRRPLGRVPRWMVPMGLALFAGGLALIAFAATSERDATNSDANLFGAVAVLGGLGVLFGMCCATPAIVGVLGPVGERLRGSGRLSARSLARTRTRSAAIVTAIAAAGALAVGGATAVSTTWNTDDSFWSTVPYIPDDMAAVQVYDTEYATTQQVVDPNDPPPFVVPTVPDAVLDDLGGALPDAEVVRVRAGAADLAPDVEHGAGAGPVHDPPPFRNSVFVIADSALMDAMGLGAVDREALAAGDVINPPGWVLDEEQATYRLPLASGTVPVVVRSFAEWPSFRAVAEYPLVSPQRAAALGLIVGTPAALLVNPEPLSEEERASVERVREEWGWAGGSAFAPAAAPQTMVVNVNVGEGLAGEPAKALVDGLILAAALLFVLAVVAVGLALSASESRDERDVLLAVGAPPRAMRWVSAQKAVLLASLGGALAVPTGFVPVAVVMAITRDDPIRFPWLVAIGCVMAIPLVVGVAALVGSTIAQRVRPIRLSTIASD